MNKINCILYEQINILDCNSQQWSTGKIYKEGIKENHLKTEYWKGPTKISSPTPDSTQGNLRIKSCISEQLNKV